MNPATSAIVQIMLQVFQPVLQARRLVLITNYPFLVIIHSFGVVPRWEVGMKIMHITVVFFINIRILEETAKGNAVHTRSVAYLGKGLSLPPLPQTAFPIALSPLPLAGVK